VARPKNGFILKIADRTSSRVIVESQFPETILTAATPLKSKVITCLNFPDSETAFFDRGI